MNQELMTAERPLAVYSDFRRQLAEWKKENEKLVFDYEDPRGNKAARSHIYKMRQSKSAVEKARKEAKQAALDYGRLVDSEAKEIVGEIESMIDVHQKPLDEIEQREKDRIAAHQSGLDNLQRYLVHDFAGESSDTIVDHIDSLSQFEPDESFEEFTASALYLYKQATEKAQSALDARLTYEAEQAELMRLRAEQEERERKEREERIAREAAEIARIAAEKEARQRAEEAERKAQAERELAAKREADAKAAVERAEQARIAAEEKAKQDAIAAEERQKAAVKAAEERAKREAAEKVAEEKAEAERREANKRHSAKINNAAAKAIMESGISEAQAKAIVVLIAQRKVPNVSITY